MEAVRLMSLRNTESWYSKPDQGEDLTAHRRTRYKTDPLGRVYMNYPMSDEDEERRRDYEKWLENIVGQTPDDLDERFHQLVEVGPSVLSRVEKLKVGDHEQALEFLGEFGWLDALYCGDESSPWNPAKMPRSSERFIYASQFWATVLQMKRALWLLRMTTTEAEFVHEAVIQVPRKHKPEWGPLWVIKWPPALAPEWANYYAESEDACQRSIQDNPHYTNVLGPATYLPSSDRAVDPLPALKSYLAERVDKELSRGLSHFYYSKLDQEYRELQIGPVDRHFWRHLADRILTVKSARRCAGPGCTKLIRPKLDRGRFCGGTCRQNFNRERKAAKNAP